MDRRVFRQGDKVVFVKRKYPYGVGDTAFVGGPSRESDFSGLMSFRDASGSWEREKIVSVVRSFRGSEGFHQKYGTDVPTDAVAFRVNIEGTRAFGAPLGRVCFLELRYNPASKSSPHAAVLLDVFKKVVLCLPNTQALQDLFDIEIEHRKTKGIKLDPLLERGVGGLFA